MLIFDAIIELNKEYEILSIKWLNKELEHNYGSIWQDYLKQKLGDIFNIHINKNSSEFMWNQEKFYYYKFRCKGDSIYYFLKMEDNLDYFYQSAFDLFSESIQFYDKNAIAIYYNRATMDLTGFRKEYAMSHKHLLELFNVDENYSTTLTSIRTQKPILNRFARYEAYNGTKLITVNDSFPVFKGDTYLGVISFEQDLNMIDSRINELTKIKAAIHSQNAKDIMGYNARGYTFVDFVGSSEKVVEVRKLAMLIAQKDSNVLIQGETGTGKEIIAQSIHNASRRNNKQFLAINCAAIPESLIESILFGTTKGSFTGSIDKAGLFEEANGGTLFLDELNSMSLVLQSKILRVLQEGTFRRVGGSKDLTTDIRIISSCNEDIFQLIKENVIRKDLFYRLGSVILELPPLREHIEDVEELLWHRISYNASNYVDVFDKVAPAVIDLLKSYNWPGNIRELNHVIDYAMDMSTGHVFEKTFLPKYILKGIDKPDIQITPQTYTTSGIDVPLKEPVVGNLQVQMDDYESKLISLALKQCGFNITKTAEVLGIKRQSLQYRIKKYGIII